MNKKTLTLALVAATLAVTSAQMFAGIRVDAVGVSPSHLTSCPQKKTFKVSQYHQYKVFGHFSNLTLGDKAGKANSRTIILSGLSGNTSTAPLAQVERSKVKLWNRMVIKSGRNSDASLDIFKSSSRGHSSTGTLLNCIPQAKVTDWSRTHRAPMLSIEGNTRNPTGQIVLCVDFIARPRIPVGNIVIGGNATRSGEKIPMAWRIHR